MFSVKNSRKDSTVEAEKPLKKKWKFSRLSLRKKISPVPKSEMIKTDLEVSAAIDQLDGNPSVKIAAVPDPTNVVSEELVCLICLAIPTEWFCVQMCGCKFCKECMEMYVRCNIQSGNIPVTCPASHCPLFQKKGGSQLNPNEVRSLVPSVFPLFLRLKRNHEVAIDPNLMWCPRPGCETVCVLMKEANKKSNHNKFLEWCLFSSRRGQTHRVTCMSCAHEFCSRCRNQWHRGVKCRTATYSDPDHNQNEHEDPIAVMEMEGLVKRCPFCQIPIEREDGCAQMMCKNCRHVFCWFCLTSLDDDFMLRHYDSGPCHSKLGHSKLTIVWHRTQVVSAFLGLGILFLVISPLVLLASPCVLCWRHHQHFHPKSSSAAGPSSTANEQN